MGEKLDFSLPQKKAKGSPVGVLTAMIGVPLFLFLLQRQRRP